MVAAARTIKVTPGSESDRLLDDTNRAPPALVQNGVRYRVKRGNAPADIWASYDPKRVQQVLAETAGAWKGSDAEAFK